MVIDGNEEVGAVNACVDGSFEVNGDLDTDNSILSSDAMWANKLGLQYHPAIWVGGMAYSGDLSG